MDEDLEVGDIVVANFPENVPPGHEQQGYRPAVVVGLPEALGTPRYPVLLVVPTITDRRQGWVTTSPELYPSLAAGSGSLSQASIVLLDQVRSLDSSRVERYLGTFTPKQYRPIADGLKMMMK